MKFCSFPWRDKMRHLMMAALTAEVFCLPLMMDKSAYAQSSINESQISQTLYVSPSGSDSNSGTSSGSAFATIQKAVNTAGNTATKIVLANGTYRAYVNIGSGSNLLIIEAQNIGGATISGADVATGWTATGTNNVYSRPWTQNWGVGTELGWWGSTTFNRRREMVYVNDARMTQRMDGSGNPVAASDLQAGQFTVDETNDRILLSPPSGVSPGSANIEVSARGYDTSYYPQTQAYSRPLIRVENHSNVVLRGLVVKRAANYMKFGAAIHFQGPEDTQSASSLPQQVLIDRCSAVDNNAIGMEINNYRNVTVKNSRFNDNGQRGAGSVQVGAERNVSRTMAVAARNYLWQDCQFNDNNWRMAGTWGDMNDSAGYKSFGQALNGYRFERCQFNNNKANGFWQDYSGENVTLDHCLIENNSGTDAGGYGILHEMTRGPITVESCVIRRNTNAGFISSGTPGVTINNSYIYYNNYNANRTNNYWGHEIRVNSDTGRDSADFTFGLQNWRITNNTLASLGGTINGQTVQGYIFEVNGADFPDGSKAPAQFAKYLQSDYNIFSKNTDDGLGDKILFSLNATDNKPNINLATWQAQTNNLGRQDLNSRFVYPPDLSNVPDPTTGVTFNAGAGNGGSSNGPNLLSNPSFDAENYDTQTPSGWSEWNNAGTSYTEAYGGSKSGSRHGTHWSTSAYEVATLQVKTGLTNGNYTFRAWVKGGGGQAIAKLYAQNYGASQISVDVNTARSEYSLVTLANIPVSNGQCEIGFWSRSNGSQWIYFDDAEFFKQGGATTAVAPIGKRIALKSASNNLYLSTNLNNSNQVQAGWATSPGSWEKYNVVDAGGGLVALLSANNNKYVSNNLNSSNNLQAGWATSIGSWEKFHWVDLGSGKIALKADNNGRFVSNAGGSGSYLQATATTSAGTSEQFIWQESP